MARGGAPARHPPDRAVLGPPPALTPARTKSRTTPLPPPPASPGPADRVSSVCLAYAVPEQMGNGYSETNKRIELVRGLSDIEQYVRYRPLQQGERTHDDADRAAPHPPARRFEVL